MNQEIYQKLYHLQTTPEALEETVTYLASQMRQFLRPNERVLICYPDTSAWSYGAVLKRAVQSCDCVPVIWGPDYRWKALLRQAFSMHLEKIIGPPMVVLGLMKLARATSTPLYVSDVVLSGYPFSSWMVEGIRRGLDCRIWGCYCVGPGPVVLGFGCNQAAGIHLREELVSAAVVDEAGRPLPDSHRGRLMLTYRKGTEEELVCDMEETAKLYHQPCSCGCDAPRMIETRYDGEADISRKMLEERFLAWSSVLDYRVEQTPFGTALELVVFPGESLPQIPNCAKLEIRPWDPESDAPFCVEEMKNFAEKDLQNC